MAMVVVVPRCLLTALLPQRNILSWQHGSIHGKGTEELQKQVWGNTLQSYEWKTTPLGASASGWGLQCAGPSPHVCPAGTEHTCAHGVPRGEHIPADTACAPVCAGHGVPSCAHLQTPMHTRLCSCTCTLCCHSGSPACVGMCSWAEPSPAVLACWV